jgi:hypothetical protein
MKSKRDLVVLLLSALCIGCNSRTDSSHDQRTTSSRSVSLLAPRANIASDDPVDVYFSNLRVTDADFPGLDSEDARLWTGFINSIADTGPRLQLALAERRLGDGSMREQLNEAENDLRRTQARSRAATASVTSATAAVNRATRSGGAAGVGDINGAEERLREAREAQDAARTAEQLAQRRRTALQEAIAHAEEIQAALTRAADTLSDDVIAPPQLGPIANRELRLGDQIVPVMNHTRANDRIGIADCDGAMPVILLAPRPTLRIAHAALLFFREHEFAHLALKHINCAVGQRTRSGGPQQEVDADCAAAKTLIKLQDGRRVVDMVFVHFYLWNLPASETHPSSVERANALLLHCAPAAPPSP